MSIGEVVGLLLTAAALSAVTGACFYELAAKRRRRVDQSWISRRDAYANWLGGQMILSRTSRSLVAAFRALAREPHDSPNFALRLQEAQRARQSWCDATSELDRAEAMLSTCSDDPDIRKRMDDVGRVTPAVLHLAINGDDRAVCELRDALDDRVEQAHGWVQYAMRDARRKRTWFSETIERCAGFARTIMDRWSSA